MPADGGALEEVVARCQHGTTTPATAPGYRSSYRSLGAGGAARPLPPPRRPNKNHKTRPYWSLLHLLPSDLFQRFWVVLLLIAKSGWSGCRCISHSGPLLFSGGKKSICASVPQSKMLLSSKTTKVFKRMWQSLQLIFLYISITGPLQTLRSFIYV